MPLTPTIKAGTVWWQYGGGSRCLLLADIQDTGGVSHHRFLTLMEQERHTHNSHNVLYLGALHTIYTSAAVALLTAIIEPP